MNPQGNYFDIYEEASSDEQTYYQWSNDNNVYTELSAPGFEEMGDGFHVFFVGENPPLDNSLANGLVGTPRNIGFVKVSKEDTREILSDGPTETGGYYTFNGDFYEQEHAGIQWLTDFDDFDTNVSRLKQISISDDKHFLIWEIWNMEAYQYTSWMIVDTSGSVTEKGDIRNICYPLRLHKADDPVRIGDDIFIYAGGNYGKIDVYKISITGF